MLEKLQERKREKLPRQMTSNEVPEVEEHIGHGQPRGYPKAQDGTSPSEETSVTLQGRSPEGTDSREQRFSGPTPKTPLPFVDNLISTSAGKMDTIHRSTPSEISDEQREDSEVILTASTETRLDSGIFRDGKKPLLSTWDIFVQALVPKSHHTPAAPSRESTSLCLGLANRMEWKNDLFFFWLTFQWEYLSSLKTNIIYM